MKLWNSINRKVEKVWNNYILGKIIPIISLIVFFYVTTPIADLLKLPKVDHNDTLISALISALILVLSLYCSLILSNLDKINSRAEKTTYVSQEKVIEHSFSKLMKKDTNIDILIYTSYSIFNEFEKLLKRYPLLSNSKMRLLLRDPDVKLLANDGMISDIRLGQLKTALLEMEESMKKYKIDVRFYKNEPWVRGIKINNSHLLYSTYGIKDNGEYSGSSTPWIEISSDKLDNTNEREFIDSFTSLYDIIWNNCTKYKNLILDLQGTLFYNDEIDEMFKQAPDRYFEYIDKGGKGEKYKESYSKLIKDAESIASTDAVVQVIEKINKRADKDKILKEYIEWKDSNIIVDNINIQIDEELIKSINKINSTYNIYILTNHTRKHSIDILKKIGLLDFIDEQKIISINETNLVKPNSKILDYLRKDMEIRINDSIFIGDRCGIDLDYVRSEALGIVKVMQPKELSKFINNLYFSYNWAKSKKYCNIEIIE